MSSNKKIEQCLGGATEIDFVHDHEFATAAGIGNASGIHIAVRKEDEARAREALKDTDFGAPSGA